VEQKFAVNDYKRVHERKKYEAEIFFIYEDRLYTGITKNISLGGAYIETHRANQFSPEGILTINIPFPSGNNNLSHKVWVKWRNDSGFAVEFI